jgi:hypothetical protein
MWDVGCLEYAGQTLWPTLSKWARLWAYAGWWRRQPSGWCGGPPHLACLVEVPKLDGFVVEVKIRKKTRVEGKKWTQSILTSPIELYIYIVPHIFTSKDHLKCNMNSYLKSTLRSS